jgi:cbb3-type cytochrome oxidase subunit 1
MNKIRLHIFKPKKPVEISYKIVLVQVVIFVWLFYLVDILFFDKIRQLYERNNLLGSILLFIPLIYLILSFIISYLSRKLKKSAGRGPAARTGSDS